MFAKCITAIQLAALCALATFSLAQQPPPAASTNVKGSIGEPSLPVVNYNACPFEGCTFRDWIVNKDPAMYSAWQDDRKLVGQLKQGQTVRGLTGVYITRRPDRFLVREPIPALSLEIGDVILQYGEWGEGAADLWIRGEWHKSFDWGQTEDGKLILTDENLMLARRGVKEWWVQVKTSDGTTGWVLADGNFDHMDQLGDAPDESEDTPAASVTTSVPQRQAVPAESPEPPVPVIHDDACPGKGRIIPHWKISREEPQYSSPGADGVQTGSLWVGQEVSVVAGTEVILKPDRILVTKAIPDLGLQADDVVPRYGRSRKGENNIWIKGEWHDGDRLATVEKNGSGCRGQCNSVVFEPGTTEWWVEISNSSGHMAWVLSTRSSKEDFWDSGNFDSLCSE